MAMRQVGAFAVAALLATATLQVLAPPAVAAGLTFAVNRTGGAVGSPGDARCDADPLAAGDQCTLAEAITEANATAGHDTIEFQRTGVFRVPAGGWPTITDPVTLDASTAPDVVRLDGADRTGTGLVVGSGGSGSAVRGLAFTRFAVALHLQSDDNVLSGGYFGVLPTGAVAGTGNGIGVLVEGDGNLIGEFGQEFDDEPVVYGQNGRGVQVVAGEENEVQNGWFGWHPDGTVAGNTIGVEATATAGETEVAGNVFSGNQVGVHDAGSSATLLVENWIGTDPTGRVQAGNGYGVRSHNARSLFLIDNVVVGSTAWAVWAEGAGAGYQLHGNRFGVVPAGTTAFPNAHGIRLAGDADSILEMEGNTVSASGGVGAYVSGVGEVTVRDNVFGSGVDRRLGNGSTGLHLHRVGEPPTPSVVSGNVLSGNGRTSGGAGLAVTRSFGVSIWENRVGVDAPGAVAFPNHGPGVSLCGGTFAWVDENVVSGNRGPGIVVGAGGGSGCRAVTVFIDGNLVGVGADGTTAIPNAGPGVQVETGQRVRVGGTPGYGNVIAHNRGAGIAVAQDGPGLTRSVEIGPNALFANAGLGIDLAEVGVTPNDVHDIDAGPNRLQNFPVLQAAVASGAATTVQGGLDSARSRSYRVDFFASPRCDRSGYGEASAFLGSATVTTDRTGHAELAATLPVVVPDGEYVTATATDAVSRETSELSACVRRRTD